MNVERHRTGFPQDVANPPYGSREDPCFAKPGTVLHGDHVLDGRPLPNSLEDHPFD
jgi:hypothetical protein